MVNAQRRKSWDLIYISFATILFNDCTITYALAPSEHSSCLVHSPCLEKKQNMRSLPQAYMFKHMIASWDILFIFNDLFHYLFMYIYVYVHMCTFTLLPSEAGRGHGMSCTWRTGSCELPNVCAWNQTLVLWTAQPLRHPPSPLGCWPLRHPSSPLGCWPLRQPPSLQGCFWGRLWNFKNWPI